MFRKKATNELYSAYLVSRRNPANNVQTFEYIEKILNDPDTKKDNGPYARRLVYGLYLSRIETLSNLAIISHPEFVKEINATFGIIKNQKDQEHHHRLASIMEQYEQQYFKLDYIVRYNSNILNKTDVTLSPEEEKEIHDQALFQKKQALQQLEILKQSNLTNVTLSDSSAALLSPNQIGSASSNRSFSFKLPNTNTTPLSITSSNSSPSYRSLHGSFGRSIPKKIAEDTNKLSDDESKDSYDSDDELLLSFPAEKETKAGSISQPTSNISTISPSNDEEQNGNPDSNLLQPKKSNTLWRVKNSALDEADPRIT